MDNYSDFVDKNKPLEKGILIIERGDFDSPEWNMTIDLNDIWSDFSSGDYKSFNGKLTDKMNDKSEEITDKCGPEAWSEIKKLVNKTLPETSTKDEYETAYDKLYDISDKFGLKLNQPDEPHTDIQQVQ